ncbi:MAG: dxs 2 [Firmicutes bacterium]|nr:dxs 2 [Bacillota bacterium]
MGTILETLNSPQDLKKLSIIEMEKLTKEIRNILIHTVSETGGHLAPNLGVVELSIALHRVFNSPTDKIVWDVGHQAYVHKILTGRYSQFSTLRQKGGLSGFPKRSESEHDAFGTGHSSTSISAALGMAIANRMTGKRSHVIAVIGDGSLTGGQAFEALNHAGHVGTDLTVILNDNEMSIAKNVGAMSEYLAKLRTDPRYSKVKRDIEYLLKRIPAIGEGVAKTVERVKDSLKYLVVPGIMFEELGFTYIGPIDGHNIFSLTDVLQTTKNIRGPVLVHVITAKGKGYPPAESNADKFHGVGPFCIESGECVVKSDKPTYTAVFGETLANLAAENPDIVAITAAMTEGTGLKKFASRYPDRFFDVGIAEPHAVTLAGGLAAAGKRPVVAVYSTFMQRAYDQVLHDICLQQLPVVFAIDRAGIVGEDGPTHHGVFDISFLRNIPGLTIMAPKDENELRYMLYTALASKGPVAIRYPRGSGLGVNTTGPLEYISGKAEELRSGKSVALVAAGAVVDICLKAAEHLSTQGIEATVINMRYIKPLDEETLRRLAKDIGIIITVEENVLTGGFGSAVLEYINSQNFNWVKLLRLGLPDSFIEHGPRNELLAAYGISPDGIAASVRSYLHGVGVR